jgi:hypothetical protein
VPVVAVAAAAARLALPAQVAPALLLAHPAHPEHDPLPQARLAAV